ncbi:hypothetical protein [Methylobacterium sp. J-077]
MIEEFVIRRGLGDEAPLQQALVSEADRLVGGSDAILVVGDPSTSSG